MIIRLAKHDGIRTINVVRRRESVAELERLGADAVIVSTEGAIDEQVRRIVGPQGVKYAIDPVVGDTGTQMYQALGEEGRMLVYGSLTGEPIRVGADPRFILAGRRILEVFWLGYWFYKFDETTLHQLIQDVVTLMRDGILLTSTAARTFSPTRFMQPSHKQNQLAGRGRYSLYLKSNRSWLHALPMRQFPVRSARSACIFYSAESAAVAAGECLNYPERVHRCHQSRRAFVCTDLDNGPEGAPHSRQRSEPRLHRHPGTE